MSYEENSQECNFHIQNGMEFFKASEYYKAISEYEIALKKIPTIKNTPPEFIENTLFQKGEILNSIGICYSKLKMTNEEEKYYKKTIHVLSELIRINPENPSCYVSLVKALYNLGTCNIKNQEYFKAFNNASEAIKFLNVSRKLGLTEKKYSARFQQINLLKNHVENKIYPKLEKHLLESKNDREDICFRKIISYNSIQKYKNKEHNRNYNVSSMSL